MLLWVLGVMLLTNVLHLSNGLIRENIIRNRSRR
jgi:hypothetical protein